jgi:type IV secretory pathway VirD2 relaxase
MVIRRVRSDGQPLQIRPAYLKHGIRETAEDLCTRQIGYRTGHDAADAERREIGEHRFTSLDRAILRNMERDTPVPDSPGFGVVKNPAEPRVLARLAVLQRMGLAESTGLNTWNVCGNFAEVLRAMQRAADRQKTLAAHAGLGPVSGLPPT